MPRTRPQNSGGFTGVYIPFPRVNSDGHFTSSAGGMLPSTETMLLTNMKLLNDPTQPISEGERIQLQKKIANTVRIGTIPAWSRVIPSNVACSNTSNKDRVLASAAGIYDVLYLRGHCAKGLDYLESSDHAVSQNVGEIAAQLDGGLDKGSQCIIKIFACESGSADVSIIPFLTSSAFTQKFANEMHRQGWRSCSFYGYEVTLKSTIPVGTTHKLTGDQASRASAVRRQFLPQV